jgi:hypothetical protein
MRQIEIRAITTGHKWVLAILVMFCIPANRSIGIRDFDKESIG